MVVYICILFLTIIFAAIAVNHGVNREIALGREVVKRRIPSGMGVFLLCSVFIFFFAARWYVGTDYENYYSRFYKLLDIDYRTILTNFRDTGFYFLSAFIGKEISTSYFVYSLLLGCLIYVPIVMVYRKYSNYFVLTCALYIMLCLYTWPYNGMRQAVAASFLFAGYRFLYNRRNYWKYGIVAILACLFHSSTLLVFPFIILTRMKPWTKRFISACVAIIVLIVLLPSLWTTVISFLESIGQTKMANDYSDLERIRSGVNFFRIAVAGLPVLLSFVYYDRLREKNPHIDMVVNMCVMNLIFLLCGYRATVIARFASFFNIGLPLLIPEFVNVFTDGSRRIAKVIIFLLFFLHMLFLLPNDSGLLPYRFIFGNV